MSELSGSATEGQYRGLPLRRFIGQYNYPLNDPRMPELLGKEHSSTIDLAIHPNHSKRIIISIPGVGGDIDGFNTKYANMAHRAQASDLGAVIRTDNDYDAGYLPDVKLRAALQYARDHAWAICGEFKPEVMLMGWSAGASAIAAIAHEFPEVTRMLLYSPAGNMGKERIQDGLKKFTGEVYIIHGEQDEIVGPDAGKKFLDSATGASHKALFMIPKCGHQFLGETNGRIMSQGPDYAFTLGKKPFFPDPNGGVKLY